MIKCYQNTKIRIALDLDDTIFVWRASHEAKFNCKLDETEDKVITEQVNSLRLDRAFWSNLPLQERPDFDPHIYSTKRVSLKTYTRENLAKYGLPIKPIYQIESQSDNKARIIKGHCDVLIDDSWFNVKQCLDAGMPALLITRPHNADIDTPYRVDHLKYREIEKKYYELFGTV